MEKKDEVSVIIPAYSLKELNHLITILKKFQKMELEKSSYFSVLLVIERNKELCNKIIQFLENQKLDYRVKVFFTTENVGLSGARNIGIQHAKGQIVAFLDSDTIPASNWLPELINVHTEKPEAGVIGGKPIIQNKKDLSLPPKEIHWLIGSHYEGLPEKIEVSYSLVGGNMSFKHETLEKIGGFNPYLARGSSYKYLGGLFFLGGEETEMFIRVRLLTDKQIFYDPNLQVHHMKDPSQLTFQKLFHSAFSLGISDKFLKKLTKKIGKTLNLKEKIPYALITLTSGREDYSKNLIKKVFHYLKNILTCKELNKNVNSLLWDILIVFAVLGGNMAYHLLSSYLNNIIESITTNTKNFYEKDVFYDGELIFDNAQELKEGNNRLNTK